MATAMAPPATAERQCFELLREADGGWQVIEHLHDGQRGRIIWSFRTWAAADHHLREAKQSHDRAYHRPGAILGQPLRRRRLLG